MAVIFVYGTLKRGGENHRYLDGQAFLGEGRTEAAYRLYLLDGYPGLVAADGGGVAVAGELWDVDAEALRRIDILEGTKVGLYRRAPVRLQPPHDQAAAETYFYARSIAGCEDLGAAYPVARGKSDPHEIIGARRPRTPHPPKAAEIAIDPDAEAEEPSPLD